MISKAGLISPMFKQLKTVNISLSISIKAVVVMMAVSNGLC